MKRRAKKWLLIALGWAVILGGVVLLPLPGPGLLVIAAGVYLLSRQSEWARARLDRGRRVLRRRWPEGYRRLEAAKDEAREKVRAALR
jgi:hypothetical protein